MVKIERITNVPKKSEMKKEKRKRKRERVKNRNLSAAIQSPPDPGALIFKMDAKNRHC
jgi:hypothetical protein